MSKPRKFLTPSELKVFKRWGVPVRYINGTQRRRIFTRDNYKCRRCGKSDIRNLTVAHIVPYRDGILKRGYTPDYLNRDANLVVACRKGCNKLAAKRI